ncbi:hypothetical protein M3Y95_00344200 [Aphelenchoides besseyi]|nr:hypothetical protein M3Y95_00344200 [Aphelenchoides besseyi]
MNSMLSLLILVVVSLTLACAYPCFYCHYDTNAPGDDYEKCKTPYWFTTKYEDGPICRSNLFTNGATFRKPVDDSQYDDSYPMNTCIYLSSDHVICQCNYSFCNNEQIYSFLFFFIARHAVAQPAWASINCYHCMYERSEGNDPFNCKMPHPQTTNCNIHNFCFCHYTHSNGVMGRWGMNCVEQTMPMNYCQRNELGDFWCQCNYDYCNSNPVPNIPGFVGLISMKDPSIRIPMSNFTSGPKFEARRD